MLWTAFTIRDQWTIISGQLVTSAGQALEKKTGRSLHLLSESPQNEVREKRLTRNKSDDVPRVRPESPSQSFVTLGTPDWTLRTPKGVLSPHVIFARSVDWASTPLGDMHSWTKEFRQVTNLLMVRTSGTKHFFSYV